MGINIYSDVCPDNVIHNKFGVETKPEPPLHDKCRVYSHERAEILSITLE
jgi:hypothetical protein